MSKAFRKTEKTMSPPGCLRFERPVATDVAAANVRKRAMAERLKGSGRSLADAHQTKSPPQREESEGP